MPTASPKAIRAAAPPPTALNRLTNCGIAVIRTRRAVTRPATRRRASTDGEDRAAAAVMTWSWASSTTVVATAAVIPTAEIWLPRRAVAGEVIRCSPSTKQTAAAR